MTQVIEYNHANEWNERITEVSTYTNEAGQELKAISYHSYEHKYFMVLEGGKLHEISIEKFFDYKGEGYELTKEEYYFVNEESL